VIVNSFVALVVPTTSLPKLIDVADSVVGATPQPNKLAVSGLFVALVLTVSDPAGSAPRAVGVNVIEMVQLELAPSVLPHVVEDTA